MVVVAITGSIVIEGFLVSTNARVFTTCEVQVGVSAIATDPITTSTEPSLDMVWLVGETEAMVGSAT